MAITLPFGIRLFAGLLGTSIDRVGKLPQELPTLAVSFAGQAVRTSFRIRQEIAELATRGDELLAGITGRPQEKPAWATFDEDEEPSVGPSAGAPASGRPGTGTPTSTVPTPTTPAPTKPAPTPSTTRSTRARSTPTRSTAIRSTATRSTPPVATPTVAPPTVPVPTNRIRASRTVSPPAPPTTVSPRTGRPTPRIPGASAGSPVAPRPRSAPTGPGRAQPSGSPTTAPLSGARPPGTSLSGVPLSGAPVSSAPVSSAPVSSAPTTTGAATPITGDHLLSIAELKEELQEMEIAVVRELLVWEETGPNRAAYLTLLSNRLTTMAHENGQSESR